MSLSQGTSIRRRH